MENVPIAVFWLTCAALAWSPAAQAQSLFSFSDEAEFQNAVASHTLINLDDAPLANFATPCTLEEAGPAAAFLSLGLDLFFVDRTPKQMMRGED